MWSVESVARHSSADNIGIGKICWVWWISKILALGGRCLAFSGSPGWQEIPGSKVLDLAQVMEDFSFRVSLHDKILVLQKFAFEE